ncbi:MAG TPA: 23S rRNA (pseudouridine(1915)-N(3))-methyltransferase RlmH [Flavobacteriales bacterium]|nr:23S rRNA (pseudouridine(1915)-N(3))-methyltransferase RlmH [Flavobacteriales bacterium]
MKIRLIVIGKTSESYLREGIKNYAGRLSHYTDFSMIELDEIKGSKKISMDDYRKKEAVKLIPQLSAERIILLDEKGKKYTSFGFAKKINKAMIQGVRSMDFVVGGPFGFDSSVREIAHESLSLSDMTFSHQMIRLFFAEQLYRAMTIIKGESYHHA